MAKRTFAIPDDFRAFMAEVAKRLEAGEDERLDQDDALQSECAYGGRVGGGAGFQFVYFPEARDERWTLRLTHHEIRAIAQGELRELAASMERRVRGARRSPTKQAVLVWGRSPCDSVAIESGEQLEEALRRRRGERACVFHLWSRCDDLLRAVALKDRCSLQIVWSDGSYASARGDSARAEAFDAEDIEGQPITVRWADCVSWPVALEAMQRFAEAGELGGLPTVASIDANFLQRARAGRGQAVALTSLPPPGSSPPAPPTEVALEEGDEDLAWARRLIERLCQAKLLELSDPIEAAIEVARLLRESGDEALAAHEEAEELAEAIADLRSVAELYATADELRQGLRDTCGAHARRP